MSIGLMALLDDVAALAKVAAASLDDIAGHAAKASMKSAGVVIDDAAVAPRYVVGFAAERELPIVGKIAMGSLKNKLIFLLPAAMLLSIFAPWGITPLLMMGGLYLCYEGAEKVLEAVLPHEAHAHEEEVGLAPSDPQQLEDQKVASAIRTDFILSAEIMAIALSTIPEASFFAQAATLLVVGVGITVAVYGAVAIIVKADDVGVALAQHSFGGFRVFGRALVALMPKFLVALAVIGTAAMIWVGGGIILHGLEHYGLGGLAHWIHDVAEAAGHSVGTAVGFVEWLVGAAFAGVIGLIVGAIMIPVVSRVLTPAWSAINGARA